MDISTLVEISNIAVVIRSIENCTEFPNESRYFNSFLLFKNQLNDTPAFTTITIGRKKTDSIKLQDQTISASHLNINLCVAEIKNQSEPKPPTARNDRYNVAITLIDSSTNGTWIGRNKLESNKPVLVAPILQNIPGYNDKIFVSSTYSDFNSKEIISLSKPLIATQQIFAFQIICVPIPANINVPNINKFLVDLLDEPPNKLNSNVCGSASTYSGFSPSNLHSLSDSPSMVIMLESEISELRIELQNKSNTIAKLEEKMKTLENNYENSQSTITQLQTVSKSLDAHIAELEAQQFKLKMRLEHSQKTNKDLLHHLQNLENKHNEQLNINSHYQKTLAKTSCLLSTFAKSLLPLHSTENSIQQTCNGLLESNELSSDGINTC